MAVVKNLMVRAGADFSGLSNEMKKSKKEMDRFAKQTESNMRKVSTTMKSTKGGFSSALGGIGELLAPETLGISLAAASVAEGLTVASKSAIDLETSVTQIGNTLGESTIEFEKWASSVGASLGYSEKMANQTGSVYSNIISGFSSDTEVMTKNTEDLMKATAVIMSRTGRTMEDVTERIRSGMLGNTEAIEDLGVYVGVKMIESTNAFKQFAGGKHWDQLNFQTQQQIRLMAILEQTQNKYGNTLADTTATRINRLKAEWDNFVTNLGVAILPILSNVIKGATEVIHAISVSSKFVSSFFKGLLGYKDPPVAKKSQTDNINKQKNAVNGLGNAIDGVTKAKEKASKGVAGFDEVNTLGNASSSGIGSGMFDGIGKSASDNLPEVENLNETISKLSQGLREIGTGIKDIFTGNFSKGVSEVASGFRTIFDSVFNKEDKKYMWNAMQEMKFGLDNFRNGNYKQGLDEMSNGFKKIFDRVFERMESKHIWDGIDLIGHSISFFTNYGFGPSISSIAKSFKELFDITNGKGMGSLLSESWNKIAGFLNKFIKSYNDFTVDISDINIFGKKPFKGLGKIDELPKLAKGGITNGPMVAMIGDNPGGQEIVSPLDKLTGIVTTAVIQAMQFTQGSNSSGPSGDVIFNIDGREFARVYQPFAKQEDNRNGINLRVQPI